MWTRSEIIYTPHEEYILHMRPYSRTRKGRKLVPWEAFEYRVPNRMADKKPYRGPDEPEPAMKPISSNIIP